MTTADSARRGRILLVEDDHEAAYFAVHVLTTRGHFDVTHTMDPRVALDRARSEPWDLVLTDLDLPGMTGLDLLAALREATPALPVVVLTAQLPEGSALSQLRASADACLEKPVMPGQLVAAVTVLITGTCRAQLFSNFEQTPHRLTFRADSGGYTADHDKQHVDRRHGDKRGRIRPSA